MNQDLLMRKFSLALIGLAFCAFGWAQEDGSQLEVTYIDDERPQAVTPRSSQSAVVRERERQQTVIPSIATRMVLEEAEKEVVLLPSVDTISAAEIQAYQRRDLSSVLRQTAGVGVVSNGAEGAVTSLFIRGLESDHTAVLLNGRRLPRGLSGQYQLEFQDVSTLESVQISRGPASALYGSDALAGAIDLRSTDARFVESDSLSVYGEGGSFDTFRTGGNLTLREGAVGIALEGSFLDTGGHRVRSAYDNTTFRGNVAIEVADGVYFDFLASVQDSFLQVPGSRSAFDFPQQQTNENQSGLFSPRISIIRDDWDFSFHYSYTENELRAEDAPFFNDNLLEQEGDELEAVFNYRPSDDLTLTLGGGHYSYSFERTPLTPSFFNSPAEFGYRYDSVFGQIEMALPWNFHLLASGRYDDHDTYDSEGTYSVQLSHEVEATGTTIFGKIGTGYKAPNGQDLLFTSSINNASDLAPEESFSYEVGIRQRLFDGKGQVGVTYFNNDIENLVDNDPFTFAASQVDTKTEGVELEFVVQATDRLSLYANYTYLDARVTDGFYAILDAPGDRLIRRPRHTLSAGAVYTADCWQLGAEINGAYDRLDRGDFGGPSQIDIGGYTVARFFGSLQLNENVELYGRIENAFDEDYEFTPGFDAAGIGAYAGALITFGR